MVTNKTTEPITVAGNAPENVVVLIVDDVPTNIAVLFEYLNALDMTVLVTQDGESGLQLARQEQPDIILLDVMMPQVDGFETCRRLKSDEATRDIPVLFMTALTDTASKIRGFEAGAVDYITKPIQQEEVVARIDAHVTIARQHNRLIRFFSILAHDLRTPFSSLVNLTRLVADNAQTWDREELAQRVATVHQTCSNIYRLTDNLLTWARLQQNVESVHRESLLIREAVMEAVAVCRDQAGEKAIQLDYDAVADDLRVLCDRNMLLVVLRNLISNAVKFTPRHGSVCIGARTANDALAAEDARTAEDARVVITVRDNGVGIAAAVLPQLLNLDARVQTPGTDREKGSGLGLILCRDMLAKNNGSLHIASVEGEGTTVTVDLPRAALSDHNSPQRSQP